MIAFPASERCGRLGGKGWSEVPGGYDAIVIGGGIQGAMVALEAARRGLRPLLLERDDFGQHTSWNSLRILHGGLRYLQSLDLARCRQSARERQWFLRNFPDLCQPLPCLMPLYGDGMKRPEIFRAALAMNDVMTAGLGSTLPTGRVLGAEETVEMFPGVRREGLRGAALWHDGTMPDSQRVIMETLRWAAHLGARCINHVEVTGLLRGARGYVEGVRARDRRTGAVVEVRAPVVLNCAGPWLRRLLDGVGQDREELFRPALAFNLVLRRPAPSTAAVAVSPPDGGATYFLTPWKGHLLAGTGHHPWPGGAVHAQDEVVPSGEQVDRFLNDLNRSVPGLSLHRSDVRGCMAGLLPAAAVGQPEPSRRPIILDHGRDGGPAGLISVSGVKFTTARLVAEQAVRVAFGKRAEKLPAREAERPAPAPVMPAAAIVHAIRHDAPAARRELLRLLRDEAVWTIDDLMVRRTDWGSCPVNARTVRDGVLALVERDPMLAGLTARHPADRASA